MPNTPNLSAVDLKPASPEWKYVDHFTLNQVGYLWDGYEPIRPSSMRKTNTPANYAAVIQRLEGLIQDGTLITKRQNPHMIGALTEVTRDDLVKALEERGPLPAFLFDTTLNDEALNLADNDEGEGELSFEDKNGGRRPSYNWNRIAAAALLLETTEGLVDQKTGKPLEFMEMCRRIHEYVEQGFSLLGDGKRHRAPDISNLQKRLGGFLKEFVKLRQKDELEKLSKK